MDTDPYGTFSSHVEDQLRRYADAFFEADDAIKAANLELKPYRQAKKEAKEKLEELMESTGRRSVLLDERGERLELATRRAKKQPDEDTIRDRCRTFCKTPADAERTFKFITETALSKVEEVVPVLKRRKLKEGPPEETGGVSEEDE